LPFKRQGAKHGMMALVDGT
jgi:hypothetical protein